MNIVKPQTIAGVMELLPDDQLVFDHIKQIIEETFLSYQFLPIDTPAIEKMIFYLLKVAEKLKNKFLGLILQKRICL